MEIAQQVSEFLEEKEGLARQDDLSFATVEQYRFVLERVFLPWCGTEIVDASLCTDVAMKRFTTALVSRPRPLSRASLRTYIRAVRVFLTWASVPKGKYKPPQTKERLIEILSRQEIDKLEAAASNERDRLIVRVLADTGIRVGELIGLRPIDLRANKHDRRYFIHVIGKGDREREVGVPSGVFERLEAYAKHAKLNVFEPRYGAGPLTRHGIDKLMRHLALKAKIGKRVYPHLMRHSFVTLMARRKIALQDTMKAVGHKTAAMTMMIYNHTTADDSYDSMMIALK